jgi:hypothetical protein
MTPVAGFSKYQFGLIYTRSKVCPDPAISPIATADPAPFSIVAAAVPSALKVGVVVALAAVALTDSRKPLVSTVTVGLYAPVIASAVPPATAYV